MGTLSGGKDAVLSGKQQSRVNRLSSQILNTYSIKILLAVLILLFLFLAFVSL